MKLLWEKYKSLPVAVKASGWYMLCNIIQNGLGFITLPIFTRILTTEEAAQLADIDCILVLGCQVKHATRISIDEKGVTAAAFTLIIRCGAAPPPEDEVDFVLDRPFMFCIESEDDLPLFTGIVNEP